MGKKIFTTLFIVAVIGTVVFAIKKPNQKKPADNNPPKEENKAQQVMPDLGKTADVPKDQLPLNFPANFPTEKGAEVVNNTTYSPNNPDERSQSTREYLSQKTLQENYDLFQTYLKKNGWNIIGFLNDTETKVLNAEKASFKLNLHFTQDPLTKKTLVSAYLVYKK